MNVIKLHVFFMGDNVEESGQVWRHTPEQRVAASICNGILQPPSGHRPGRRQARHAHILQIGLRLAIAQADARPVMSISFR